MSNGPTDRQELADRRSKFYQHLADIEKKLPYCKDEVNRDAIRAEIKLVKQMIANINRVIGK